MTETAIPTLTSAAPPLAVALASSIDLIASKLKDPNRVAQLADRSENREPLFGSSMWAPATLSHGWAGTATFFAELSREDSCWLPVADRHLRCAVESLSSNGSDGLFAGPASVLCAALVLRPNYAVLRSRLTEWVARDQVSRLSEARRRPGLGVAWSDYDAINGLAGTGRLLLACVQEGGESASLAHEAVQLTIDHMCSLAVPLQVGEVEVPGWWVPSHLEPVPQDQATYANGDFNLGLAHGVAGPLAFLSQAINNGYDRASVRDAIATMSQWLSGWALNDDAGIYWPCRVSWEDELAHRERAPIDPLPFSRTAWCYGAPGLAAALFQAGTATTDPGLRTIAGDAVRAITRRPMSQWKISGTTVCHGVSGVLAAVLSASGALQAGEIDMFCTRLAGDLAAAADENAAFGYVHEMPSSLKGWQHDSAPVLLDGAGLLEGAAGVGCTLLSSYRRVDEDRQRHDDEFGWQCAFLLQ